ncbi:MAG: hypothetical protein PHQ35_09675 [Phycisphaerae bacterium]|nr:hypothetical protein [Phycisphaerae bacterium]
MYKEYFDSLRPIEQAEVSIVVDSAISEMIEERFNFSQTTAFVELLKERLGNLDVAPRNMIESRMGVGNTEYEEGRLEGESSPSETTTDSRDCAEVLESEPNY